MSEKDKSPLAEKHWLKFYALESNEYDLEHRYITGCQCGFVADPDDQGWGDSVVAHIIVEAEKVARKDEREKIMSIISREGQKYLVDLIISLRDHEK